MASHTRFVGFLGAALLFGTAAAGVAGCAVEAYPAGYATVDDYPPDAYIATAEPVYYEGRPAYFWHNRWVYRDGGRWGGYAHEPPELAARRGRPMGRVNYGRASVRGGFRR
jgi:hypothetical protein